MIFWAQYTVSYLDKNDRFGRALVKIGRCIAVDIALLSFINIFVPVLFSLGGDCSYNALFSRYVVLACQIAMLISISLYSASFAKNNLLRSSGDIIHFRSSVCTPGTGRIDT